MSHLTRFRQKMANAAEAALISTPQNQLYLSSFDYSDGYLLIFADDAYLLTDFRYIEAARAGAAEGFTVREAAGGMAETVRELLAAHGTTTLWVEEEGLTLSAYVAWEKKLPDVKITGGASAALAALRVRKDAAEIAAIRAAQELTDAAFSHILTCLRRPDITEIGVALELEFFMRKNGAEGMAFDVIAVSGSASSMPHGVPRDVPLKNGFLTMDFGARLRGYCSDMTRTVVVGKADTEMKRLYGTVLAAQRAALAVAGAGVSCREVDRVARDLIEAGGYHGAFGHSLGHGVGIDIHEKPNLSPKAVPELLLQTGHVVTVEPGIYLQGKYGCRIEDMIVIGEDGTALDITKSEKELIEV